MDKVLFVGNGINRIHSGYSWADLLEELKKDTQTNKEIMNGNKPFPVLYEEIYFRSKRNLQFKEGDLLKAIVKKMKHLLPTVIHKQIMDLSISNIITTNYDYTLENSVQKEFKIQNTIPDMAAEKVYRITTRNCVEDKSIWHVHGELKYPRSIVLGQNMYAKVVGKMNAYIEQDDFLKAYHSWIDFMFLKEVHMIGFGLDYSEIDIWAVLNARVRYFHKHENENTIYFYIYTENPKDISELETILESYHINVIKNKENEDPETFYMRILQAL
ncbi:hypothetical protein M2475_001152 [Breznakia sp. PF5-3]|uniref:SIR2 family protein n=1 Tax=unclassified Breznakia TaxID=2623764 RepID=UPI00240672F2|nr:MULTISPECIES: SIR2 family protein [unclassified Breznakia]MDL2276259.1 SIR2 family protein [Breznakia sp. OttesenSCG-928-G09]MDF9824917.1 hypothetical protein [Breznakia sp. PM6-1]MDF9835584.1 hypothetical protein [Breznakia sp. PF5-3]MDF9838000.1 hypothetical protein [Breznakia sp. PFB2-8]MDF9859989.1 hypothetical protein [Breznakia sp. PH5-24]